MDEKRKENRKSNASLMGNRMKEGRMDEKRGMMGCERE